MRRFYTSIFLTSFVLFGFSQENTESVDQPQSTIEPSDEIFDVFLVAGQSNTLNGCCKDPAVQKTDSLIMQLGRFDEENLEIILAKEPLAHHNTKPNRIGFAMTFAMMYKDKYLDEEKKILIIPTGHGGTGFIDNHWNPGDDYYEDAVMRVNYVFQKYPNSKLRAILWQQGEKDVNQKSNHYRADLDTMIVQIRKDLDVADLSVPFFMGGMVPYWVDKKKRRGVQQRYIRKTAERHPNVWYVSPYDPFRIKKEDNKADEIHYDAKGQIELGKRYFYQYEAYLQKED